MFHAIWIYCVGVYDSWRMAYCDEVAPIRPYINEAPYRIGLQFFDS